MLKKALVMARDLAQFSCYRGLMLAHVFASYVKKQQRLGNKVSRILVIRFASLGDVIRATAVVEALSKKHPQAKIDFLTSSAGLPVLNGNPCLNQVFSLRELCSLDAYDWIINLQRPDPPLGFLADSNLTYPEILEHISHRVEHKFITGRHFNGKDEVLFTDAHFCRTEIEELFLIALLRFSLRRSPVPRIYLEGEGAHSRTVIAEGIPLLHHSESFGLSRKAPSLGIFLGSNSFAGHDDGFRTYSIDYLEKLVERFYSRFEIVIVGESRMKTEPEIAQYKELLRRYPRIVDLVDRTSLNDLLSVINALKVFISCDSGPLHMAAGLGVPLVGLFVNSSAYRAYPQPASSKMVLLDSFPPCFEYNYRWRFFCMSCDEGHFTKYGCFIKQIENKLDLIPVEKVEEAVDRLVGA